MPNPRSRTRLLLGAAAVLVVLVVVAVVVTVAPRGRSSAPASAAPPPGGIPIRVITLNDLHGNLEPPKGSSGRVTVPGKPPVDAGGAAYLATHIAQLRAAAKNSVLLSAGDNIGASPLASALFHDEPTVDLLDELGVAASALGNHELDHGFAELQRIQHGGCAADGCQYEPAFPGARFPILGANVTDDAGKPALPASTVVTVGGVRIGVIGATLRELPTVVTPEAVRGLRFGDEIAAVNQASDALTAQGVKVQVLVVHQGDEGAGGGPSDCSVEPNGLGSAIARGVSPAIDAVFTAHTHQQYVCTVTDPAGAPRPMVQGLAFGRLLSVVDLVVDPATGDVARSATTARNEVVTRDVPPDPAAEKIVDKAVAEAAPKANVQIGSITADLTRAGPPSGETPLGDVIADAQLDGTRADGAQLAITNPGGIRADLVRAGDGVVTYGEAFTVQPFSNIMQTITMTGAQLKAVLEQQWHAGTPDGTPTFLQVSATLHYTWSASAPVGNKVSALAVAGAPVDPAATYRVGVNNFLAAGGDGFTTFAQAANVTGGPIDLDALVAYLRAHPALPPPPADRVTTAP